MKRRKSRKLPDELLRQIFREQGGKCAECYSAQLDTHPHHIKYRSRGGSNDRKNLVWLCRRCHNLTHSGHPDMARYRTHRWQDEGQTEADAESNTPTEV
jgi:5-methylcytosine-specific restriction endonuclease McrA